MQDAGTANISQNSDPMLAAFEQVVENLQQDAWRLALSILRDYHEAEDAVAEAFVKVWRALPGNGEVQVPRAWLLKIVRNVCLDALRRRRSRGEALGEDDTLSMLEGFADARPGPEEAALSQEGRHQLWQGLQSLPEADRTALILRYWHEASYEEIAQVTGWRPGTVASRLSRAKEKLGKQLTGGM